MNAIKTILNDHNINLYKNDGEIRSFNEVWNDLMLNWAVLSETERQTLADAAASGTINEAISNASNIEFACYDVSRWTLEIAGHGYWLDTVFSESVTYRCDGHVVVELTAEIISPKVFDLLSRDIPIKLDRYRTAKTTDGTTIAITEFFDRVRLDHIDDVGGKSDVHKIKLTMMRSDNSSNEIYRIKV